MDDAWMLMDASDPLNLVPTYTAAAASPPDAIALRGNALYVAFSSPSPEIDVWDATDPSAPSYATTLGLSSLAYGFAFKDDHMYVSTPGAIEVYSLTNPLLPNHVDSYSYSPFGYSEAAVQGDYLYMVTGQSLELAGLSDPGWPTFSGDVALPIDGSDCFRSITVDGQFAFVGGYLVETTTCLAWPPEDPTVVGPVHDDALPVVLDLLNDSGYLYEATATSGLHIYDLY
jgi:hypothetical protein